ncbi:MAG: hypothetical protein K1X74_15840 [Pirellulales bacterium]|nr:hypothetical protein [Pirellulales bacterium]
MAIFVVCWLAITLWRWEIVASPPYWDSAMGLFLEAHFLSESGFDYQRLWYEEPRFLEGGPGVYLHSIVPTLLALVMRLTSSPHSVMFVGHLATFALAAATATTTVALLRPRIGWIGALLTVVALVTTPVFAVQVDMIGMDLPLALTGLLMAGCLISERYLGAVAVGCLAFFIKQSGGVLLVASAVYLAALCCLAACARDRAAQRHTLTALGTLLLVLAGCLTLVLWSSQLPQSSPERLPVDTREGMRSLTQLLYWCPTWIAVVAVAGVSTLMAMRGALSEPTSESSPEHPHEGPAAGNRWNALVDALWRQRSCWVFGLFTWIVAGGMLAGLTLSYTIPRYITMAIPLVLVMLAMLWGHRAALRPVALAGAVALIAVNLVQLHGYLLPPVERASTHGVFDRRTGAVLERSREYLADHRENIRLAAILEQQASGRPIVTGNPFAYLLSLPMLGYVNQPLHGYTVNTYVSASFKPSPDLLQDLPAEVIVVRAENRFTPIGTGTLPRPLPTSPTLFRGANDALVAFVHSVPERATPQQRRAALLGLLWPEEGLRELVGKLVAERRFAEARKAVLRIFDRAPGNAGAELMLVDLDLTERQQEKARARLMSLVAANPQYGPARVRYADMFLAEKAWARAVEQFEAALNIGAYCASLAPAELADVYVRCGVARRHLGQREPALADFERALASNPTSATAHRASGELLLELDRDSEAEPHLAQAVKLEPREASTAALWGATLARLGRRDDAIRAYTLSIEAEPQRIDSHYELGRLMLQSGDIAAALVQFRQVIQYGPTSDLAIEAARQGAWLLATTREASLFDPGQAIDWAQRAVRATKRRRWECLDALAAAYAGASRFDEAVQTAEEALALLAGDPAQPDQRAAVESRLNLYRQGLPFREH